MTLENGAALPPGSTIGIIGSGQLGRMTAIAAAQLGYQVHTLTGGASDTPTGQVCHKEVVGAYDDPEALREFLSDVDVVTFEFENVDAVVGEIANDMQVPVRPSAELLYTTQHRAREKQFLRNGGFPIADFAVVTDEASVQAAFDQIGMPAVLKTAAFGYDGKGQILLPAAATASDLQQAWQDLGSQECVLEELIDFDREASVVVSRSPHGDIAVYAPFANDHVNHILDTTTSPAPLSEQLSDQAQAIATGIADALDLEGILCVEMFIAGDRVLVNELAPRPHNSGHLTIEAHATSQFEQHVRSVTGLRLGSVHQRQPAAMVNLLGDVWDAGEPHWGITASTDGNDADVHLHLYGKSEARPGRKMGHVTALAETVDSARERATSFRNRLTTQGETE